MSPIEIAYAHTPEWWAARRTGIGASRAAAVLQVPKTDDDDAIYISQYNGPFSVYKECRGELEPEPETDAMFAGKVYEEPTARMYERRIGRPITYPCPMYRHPEWPYMLATPDVQVDEKRGAEIKVSNWRVAQKIRDFGLGNAVPDYVAQCNQQMAVMSWDVVDLVVAVGKELHVYVVERSDRLIEMIAEAEAKLWERIEAGDPPELDPEEPGAFELIKRLHPAIKPGIVHLSGKSIQLQSEYVDLSKQAREIEARKKVIRTRQLLEIGDHEGGLLPDGRYLKRSIVEREEYTVAASKYPTARVCKLPDDAQIIEPAGPLALTGGE